MPVLVVDDYKSVTDVIERVLVAEGYVVYVCHTSKDALEYINNNPKTRVALIDLILPDLSGLELIKEIRKTNQTLYIIIMTGYADLLGKENIEKAGANDLLIKPFSIQRLQNIIKDIMKKLS